MREVTVQCIIGAQQLHKGNFKHRGKRHNIADPKLHVTSHMSCSVMTPRSYRSIPTSAIGLI